MNEVLKQAIHNTPVKYFMTMLARHNPGSATHVSVFETEQDFHSLQEASWEPYEHEAVEEPARCFRAPIPGFLGVVSILELPKEKLVHFEPSSTQGSGFMDALVLVSQERAKELRKRVDFSVAIVGPGGDNRDILWAVFPGDPIPPSTLVVEGLPTVLAVPATVAIEKGLMWAKIEVRG